MLRLRSRRLRRPHQPRADCTPRSRQTAQHCRQLPPHHTYTPQHPARHNATRSNASEDVGNTHTQIVIESYPFVPSKTRNVASWFGMYRKNQSIKLTCPAEQASSPCPPRYACRLAASGDASAMLRLLVALLLVSAAAAGAMFPLSAAPHCALHRQNVRHAGGAGRVCVAGAMRHMCVLWGCFTAAPSVNCVMGVYCLLWLR